MSKCVLCGSEFDIECEECDYMALNDYATSVERELYELRQKIQGGEIPSDLVNHSRGSRNGITAKSDRR